MKKNKVFMVILMTIAAILLSACGEVEVEEKEFIYMGKKEPSGLFSNYSIHFESIEDRTYYYVNVSSWEYDNFEAVKGDVFKFNFVPQSLLNNRSIEIFDKYRDLRISSDSFSE